MSDPRENPQSMGFALSWDESGSSMYVNGQPAGEYRSAPMGPSPRVRRPIDLDPIKLQGPALKISRAKRHLQELDSALHAFFASNPYELVAQPDPQTGEAVYRVRVHKPLPSELSIITGDVLHNLRSALDQMICELVRLNRQQVRNGNSFPIMGSARSFEEACIGKLKNIPVKAERFIRRLKPYQGGNPTLWMLSELDNMDKHNTIVPVAAGQVQMLMQVGMPGLFRTQDRGIALGGGPPGSVPFGFERGWMIPKGAKPVELLQDNCELYRARPELEHIPHNVQVSIQVTLGKTRVTNSEPLTETLYSLVQLVERIVYIVERRIL